MAEEVKNPMDLNGDGKVTIAEKVQYKAGQAYDKIKEEAKEAYDKASLKAKDLGEKAAVKAKELGAKAKVEAKEAYETFVSEHAPLTQNANYLRLYSSSENNLGESFEKTGTCVAVLSQPVSLPQDLHDLFSWIDEADLLQDELDEELAKQLKKEREKLARAKLLYDRANVRARKKQAKLERQARRNGGIVPYDIVTPTEKK